MCLVYNKCIFYQYFFFETSWWILMGVGKSQWAKQDQLYYLAGSRLSGEIVTGSLTIFIFYAYRCEENVGWPDDVSLLVMRERSDHPDLYSSWWLPQGKVYTVTDDSHKVRAPCVSFSSWLLPCVLLGCFHCAEAASVQLAAACPFWPVSICIWSRYERHNANIQTVWGLLVS